jgi:hypothetical protein
LSEPLLQTDDDKQRCVDLAAAEVEALVRGHNPLAAQANSNPNQATVYVGFEAPPEWGLAGRIRGGSKQGPNLAARVIWKGWVLVKVHVMGPEAAKLAGTGFTGSIQFCRGPWLFQAALDLQRIRCY